MAYKMELDYALGQFMVIPGTKELYILDSCPEELRERLLKDWPRIVAETEERHRNCIYSDQDYFAY